MRPPAFQFYPSDFLASTSEMSAEEVGVHIRLLCHQWIRGGLPDDDARLLAMAGQCQASSLAYAKTRFGMCDDGQLRHPRLEAERAKQADYREKQAANGAKRWVGNAKPHAVATPSLMPNACSPSPSPSPPSKEEIKSCASVTEAQLPLVPEPQQAKAAGPKAEAKPESLDAVHDFFTANGSTTKEADKFYDFFASNGWKVSGRAAMKDWHAAARNWIRRASEAPRGPSGAFRAVVTTAKTAMQENIDQLTKAAEEDMRQLEAARAARIAAGGPQPVPIREKIQWP